MTETGSHWDERRFYNLFGSPNVCGANNVCMCPSQAVEYATYGGFTWGDVMQTQCVVLWGHAPSQSDLIGFYPNILCPDGPEFCSPEIGGWPHSTLLCRIEKE